MSNTRRRKTAPSPAKAALVEERAAETSPAAPEAKPRSAVGKLGGVLKRINPFQKNEAAAPKDEPTKRP